MKRNSYVSVEVNLFLWLESYIHSVSGFMCLYKHL